MKRKLNKITIAQQLMAAVAVTVSSLGVCPTFLVYFLKGQQQLTTNFKLKKSA